MKEETKSSEQESTGSSQGSSIREPIYNMFRSIFSSGNNEAYSSTNEEQGIVTPNNTVHLTEDELYSQRLQEDGEFYRDLFLKIADSMYRMKMSGKVHPINDDHNPDGGTSA